MTGYKSILKNEKGSVLMLGLSFIVVLLAVAGLIIDTIRFEQDTLTLKSAAEAIALAGAKELTGMAEDICNPAGNDNAVKAMSDMATHLGISTWNADIGRYWPAMTPKFKAFKTGVVDTDVAVGCNDNAFLSGGTPYEYGVGKQALTNAIKVNVQRSGFIDFFMTPYRMLQGDPNSTRVTSASAIAVADTPHARCVAPLAIPICGLMYESDIAVSAPIAHAYQQGDFGNGNAVMQQELLFQQLVDDGSGGIRPHEYPVQIHDVGASTVTYPWASPGNVNQGVLYSGQEARNRYEILPPGVPGFAEEINPSGTATKDLFPLRGAFALSHKTLGGTGPVTKQQIAAAFEITWPSSQLRGCVPAVLGDGVSLLEDSADSNTSFEDSGNYDIDPTVSDAMKANQAVAALILESGGLSFTHSEARNTTTTPDQYELTFDEPETLDSVESPCDQASVANWLSADFPEGRQGCHTSHNANAPYGCGDIDPLSSPDGDAACDSGPDEIPISAINHPIWSTMAMVVAPTSPDTDADFCSKGTIGSEEEFRNSSDPVIVGFLPIWVFDAQIYEPGSCEYTFDNAGSPTTVTGVAQTSCRGVRAKPFSNVTFLHNRYHIKQSTTDATPATPVNPASLRAHPILVE